MTQKAAWLIDAGEDAGAGEAANSAKYAAAEAAVHDRRPGDPDATAATGCRRSTASPRCWRCPASSRIAPVSREMILNFVAQHDLGLPRSY